MNFHAKSEVCSLKNGLSYEYFVLCTFYICTLFGQSIWISMQNLESVDQKMAELWVLLYFLYFCNLFVNGCGRSRSTSKRNFGLVAQKVMINFVYLAAILFFWWPFCFSYFGCEWSRSTSMRKFGLLAQKMSDLATILFFFPNLWPLRKVTSLDKKVTSLDPNLWPLERSNPGVYLNIQPPIKNRQKYTDFETLGRRNSRNLDLKRPWSMFIFASGVRFLLYFLYRRDFLL